MNKRSLLKLLSNDVFLLSFKNFVNCLVEHAPKEGGKSLLIFLKIFIFWKIFISLWNKQAKKEFFLPINKWAQFFFMTFVWVKLRHNSSLTIKPHTASLKNHIKFLKRTYTLDLFLFWNLYYYHNIIAHFYSASFLIWAKFFFLIGHGEALLKNLLNLKNFYKFKSFNEANFKPHGFSDYMLYFSNYLNASRLLGFAKKNALFFLNAQSEALKKIFNPFGSILDRPFIASTNVLVNKQKKYTPFFFTINYEYSARRPLRLRRPPYFKKRNRMRLSI